MLSLFKTLRNELSILFDIKVNNIVYFPIISSKKDLSYLVNSIASSVPYRDNLVINLPVKDSLLDCDLSKLDILNFQGDFIRGKNLSHIKLVEYGITRLFKADLICLTDMDKLDDIVFWKYKVKNVDISKKNNVGISSFYKSINWLINSNSKNSNNLNKSKESYLRLLTEKKNAKKSLVIAGGPSVNRYKEFQYEDNDFVISINDYVIKDLGFLNYVGMDAICFSDPTLFFGASKYTKEFYNKLITAFNNKKFFIFVDIKCYEILDSYNVFGGYIIGVKMEECQWYQLLSPDNMTLSVYPRANSLTRYAGTIGLSICDTVIFLGADGVSKNKLKKINKNYSDSRNYAYQNYNLDWPLFYKTYETSLEHNNNYNKYLEQFISFASELNKNVYTLVPSNYKVLENLVWKGE